MTPDGGGVRINANDLPAGSCIKMKIPTAAVLPRSRASMMVHQRRKERALRTGVALAGLVASITAATTVTASDAGPATTPAAVSRDMCAVPADWAPPFTHLYHLRNGATVVFVGVEHTDDLADATHRQIEAAFERYKPTFVLVEGTSSAKSAFDWYRTGLVAMARRRTDEGAAAEHLYAVRLASDRGAAFSGWDFSPDQDYRVLVDDGFGIDDALGAHLLRSHVDPLGNGVAAAVDRQLRYAAMVRPVTSFDYPRWYGAHYGARYDPTAGTPCGHGIGSKAVADLSYRRNLNLAALIDGHATPGQTVLVEAGANHWLALKEWLRSRAISVD